MNTGEWIAAATPSVMLAIWWWDKERVKRLAEVTSNALRLTDQSKLAHIEVIERNLNQHLLECANRNGGVEQQLTNMNNSLGRVERHIENVQAQVRNIATNSNNKVFTDTPT